VSKREQPILDDNISQQKIAHLYPGQKTKTVNQHGTNIEIGKNYVSCLSGVAKWMLKQNI